MKIFAKTEKALADAIYEMKKECDKNDSCFETTLTEYIYKDFKHDQMSHLIEKYGADSAAMYEDAIDITVCNFLVHLFHNCKDPGHIDFIDSYVTSRFNCSIK